MFETLQRLVDEAETWHSDDTNLPPHVEGVNSAFKVLDPVKYSSLSVAEVQGLLSTHHLVIPEHARQDLPFDEESLRSVSSLNATVRIQGEHNPHPTTPNIPTSLSRSIQGWGKHHARDTETGARMLTESLW